MPNIQMKIIICCLVLATLSQTALSRDITFTRDKSNLDSLIVDGNDFTLKVTKVPDSKMVDGVTNKTIKTGGLFIQKNGLIQAHEQSNSKQFWSQFELEKILPGLSIVESNYGGVRKLFEYESNLLALLPLTSTTSSQKCFFVSLINLTQKKEIFRAPCLPDAKNNDFNAIGGGNAVLNGNLLIAIGTPDALGSITPSLAQDPSSPYGKVLSFKRDDLLQPKSHQIKKYSIFSSGHRNPQGMINIDNDIYLIEHGPKGGDEINLLKKGGNYGWPLYSLGSTYPGVPYPAAGLINKFQRPLFSFIPSAAISDIRHCPENLSHRYSPYKCVLISALRGESIFVVLIDNEEKRIVSLEQVKLGMRIREFSRGRGNDGGIYFSTDGYGVFQLLITNISSANAPRPQTWTLPLPK